MALTQEEFSRLPPEVQRLFFNPAIRPRLEQYAQEGMRAPASEDVPVDEAPTEGDVAPVTAVPKEEAFSKATTTTKDEDVKRKLREALTKKVAGTEVGTEGSNKNEAATKNTQTAGTKNIVESARDESATNAATYGIKNTSNIKDTSGISKTSATAPDLAEFAKFIAQVNYADSELGLNDQQGNDYKAQIAATIPLIKQQAITNMDLSPLVSWANTWKGEKLAMPTAKKGESHALKLQELLQKRSKQAGDQKINLAKLIAQFKGEVKTDAQLLLERGGITDFTQRKEGTVSGKIRNLNETDLQRYKEEANKVLNEHADKFLQTIQNTTQNTATDENTNKNSTGTAIQTDVKAGAGAGVAGSAGAEAKTRRTWLEKQDKEGKALQTELDMLKGAYSLLTSESSSAQRAVTYSLAKALDSGGRLSDQDIKELKPGLGTYAESFVRWWNNRIDQGLSFTKSDVDDATKFLNIQAQNVRNRFKTFANTEVAKAPEYGWNKKEAENSLYDRFGLFKREAQKAATQKPVPGKSSAVDQIKELLQGIRGGL